MAAPLFGRRMHRLPNPGVSGAPPDAMPESRLPFIQNMRSYQPGTLQPRAGLVYIENQWFLAGVHSLARLNDPTPFSTIKALRLVGAGVNLFAGDVATGIYTTPDTGYSGNPLTIVNAAPPQSPRPYAYVVDSARQRKINSDKTLYPIGLAPPTLPPSATMPRPSSTVLSECNTVGDFTAVVGSASTGAPASVSRVNTTIAAILFDTGTTGWASINATSMVNIQAGLRITIGGATETATVQECIPAVASTTIASIVYDTGTTGLCWIQPAASLGTGILDQIPLIAYTDRITGVVTPLQDVPNVPADTPSGATSLPRTRIVDFPVNGLITIGGATETVRILGVAVGPDGVQAIRCSTANTHAAADTITGVACFRVYCVSTHAAANALTADGITVVMTGTLPTGAGSVEMVGGIHTTVLGSGNLALVDATGASGTPRATLSEDVLGLAIRVDTLPYIDAVRLYLDCDAAGSGDANVFLNNYFLAEWRANDIIAAIQATNAAAVSTITDARTTVVINSQTDPGPPPADVQNPAPDTQ